MRLRGLFTCLLCLTMFSASLANAGDVWVITSLDWQPYSHSQMATQGNSIQKLRNLLKAEGIELVVEFYPWSRAQEIAKQKGYVGYFPAWPEEVGEGFTASLPVDWSEIGVMTYEQSGLQWTHLEALFQYKVGLISTYTYPADISQLAKTNPKSVDLTPNELSLLRKLSVKRIKTAITDPSVMNYLAAREGIGNIRILKVLGEKPLVLAVKNSPENRERLELLNRLLQK